MAIISPGLGEFEDVGKQLFALATDRTERRSILLVQEGPAGTSYEVPDGLYDRWLEAHGPKSTEDPPTPMRRRPGRPRLNPLPEQE